MPRYSYLAKTLDGNPRSGTSEAPDKRSLAKALRSEGMVLISAEKISHKTKTKSKIASLMPFLGKVSLKDKIMFARNLKVMISAGVSLPRALNTLSEQTDNKKFKKVLNDISSQIVKGSGFSEALNSHQEIFSTLFINMIKVGEEAGNLGEVLGVLTHHMERDHELRSKIKGAMVYPAVIVTAMVGIGILMMIVVVPKLAKTFDELGIELPLTTRFVIGAGNLMAEFWYLLIILLAGLVFLTRLFLKSSTGKNTTSFLFLKLPGSATLVKKTNAAYTARTLGSLINSGVAIVRALEITAGTLNNIYYKRAILNSAQKVKKGARLSSVLEEHENLYPSLVIQMMAVGEETGATGDMLQKLAEFYESEVSRITENISSIIEPILMIIIGAAVGFFVISMIQPMYSMMQGF